MDSKSYEVFFKRISRENPEPKSELEYGNPYQLLVAVVLSAQATDKGVNKATKSLFTKIDAPSKMLRLGEARLMKHISSIGLFRTKTKNVVALSRMLMEEHDGKVPADRDALERLPGVGRKTANVVLNVAFGKPTIAVDTHIFRVGNRTGIAPGKTPREVEDKLLERTPKRYLLNAHHWLILHGRYVCTARAPKCASCNVSDLCAYRKSNPDAAVQAMAKPNRKKRRH